MKIVDILKPSYIRIPLEASTKEDSINELIGILDNNGVIRNIENVQRAVFEREKIMSTGVGNGVAIPHCKHKDCKEFALCLGLKPGGIDFQSIDEKPARILFLLVGPEDQPGTHIRLLSRISRIISKESVRKRVFKSETPEQLFDLIREEESNLFG
jgi:mannitol/fructose-specific phosphotransferase system IIA component (Ntr-type)